MKDNYDLIKYFLDKERKVKSN